MSGRIDSRAWTGLKPTFSEAEGIGDRMFDRAWRFEEWKLDRHNDLQALAALWCPAIPQAPRDRRKGWTVYDGFERARDEEWSLWRALRTTIAIVTGRRHSDRDVERYGHRFGVNVAYFDCRSVYGGHHVMIVELFPRCKVSIFSDGETNL